MEYILGFAIVGAIIGGIAGYVSYASKKDKTSLSDMVSKLTEEQKNYLATTEVQMVGQNEWTQNAIVGSLKDNGKKVSVRLLWYNKTLQNAEYNTITIADVTITKEELIAHNLKIGDAVKLYIAPMKTVGSVKIMWD